MTTDHSSYPRCMTWPHWIAFGRFVDRNTLCEPRKVQWTPSLIEGKDRRIRLSHDLRRRGHQSSEVRSSPTIIGIDGHIEAVGVNIPVSGQRILSFIELMTGKHLECARDVFFGHESDDYIIVVCGHLFMSPVVLRATLEMLMCDDSTRSCLRSITSGLVLVSQRDSKGFNRNRSVSRIETNWLTPKA